MPTIDATVRRPDVRWCCGGIVAISFASQEGAGRRSREEPLSSKMPHDDLRCEAWGVCFFLRASTTGPLRGGPCWRPMATGQGLQRADADEPRGRVQQRQDRREGAMLLAPTSYLSRQLLRSSGTCLPAGQSLQPSQPSVWSIVKILPRLYAIKRNSQRLQGKRCLPNYVLNCCQPCRQI